MRRSPKFTAAALAGALLATVLATGASAEDTTVDGTIASSISISTAPSASVAMTLPTTGTATTSGGNIAVTANEDYTLTVVGNKAKMTEYGTAFITDTNGDGLDDTTGQSTAYGTGTLGSSLSVVAGYVSGAGVPATAIVSTNPATLATSVGLTTDEYSLTLSQPTTIADKAGTYRIVLTYTASPTL